MTLLTTVILLTSCSRSLPVLEYTGRITEKLYLLTFPIITTHTEMGLSDVAEVLNHPCFCKKLRKLNVLYL